MPGASKVAGPPTADAEYTRRLEALQTVWWKRLLPVQAPYAWNLRRLRPGFTLEIGCGIGRNLLHLGGEGVGLDHNPHSVELCRRRGLKAFAPAEFSASSFNRPAGFDSILLSHVAEHLTPEEARALLSTHLPLLKPAGRVILITPQECGQASDPTHVTFMDPEAVAALARACGLGVIRSYSFPFPRWMGKLFIYNEFISVLARP